MSLIINKAISALDTPTSLLPFFVKDAFDVTGRTVMANNEGGKHEAREKFIEEAGTSLFWIGGIPTVRWVVDQIAKNKIDSKIQFKRINTDGIQNYFANKLEESSIDTVANNNKKIIKQKFSAKDLQGIELGGEKLGKIQEKLKKAGFKVNGSKGLYKKYHLGVTTAAVLVNLAMLSVVIPQLNQLLSRKIISKETNGKKNYSANDSQESIPVEINDKFTINNVEENTKISNTKNNKPLSFGSLKELIDFKNLLNFTEMAEKAQLNPVNGMLLLDYGISGSRVTITPRNSNERVENAIKEGGIIFFFYYASGVIKQKLAEFANKTLNIPIDLDYKIINNADFLDKFKKTHSKDELLKFVKLEKDDTKAELKVIKMIDEELTKSNKDSKIGELFKNFTLQMAQKEGLIDVEYDSQLKKYVRHSEKYIQTDKIIDLNKNLNNFYNKALDKMNSSTKNISIEDVVSKTKKVKIASVIGNMAICCASLSFIVPKIQYLIREHRTKTKAAPGIKQYQEMAEQNLI